MKYLTKHYFATILLMALLTALTSSQALAGSDEVMDIDWQMLVPKDYQPQNPLEDLTAEQLNQLTDSSPEAQRLLKLMEEARNSAPVVEELNDKVVRLPGFVVPIDFIGTDVSEFLLVPYFGACIHVPPPPANQIVYVKSEQGVNVEGLFAAVNVTGKITTQSNSNELAEAGYTIEAYEVTPYE